ncbi:MAG: DUF2793 domain-containing protein [Pseudomonadota bacterium]
MNEALSLIDAVMQKTVIATQSTPPSDPNPGDTYRVASGALEWVGQDDALAIFFGGSWHFLTPANGSMIFDQSAAHFLHFSNSWVAASTPTSPQGGSNIDTEARAAIDQVIQSLQIVGLYV